MLVLRVLLRRVRVTSRRYIPQVLLLVLRVLLLRRVIRLLPVVLLLRRAGDRLILPRQIWGTPRRRRRRRRCRAQDM